MGVTAGLNLAGWQLRHNGQWQWQDTPAENQSKSDYQETSTYLQRAFPKYRGVLTLGDSFTNGEVFDSYGYRGIDFQVMIECYRIVCLVMLHVSVVMQNQCKS